VYLFGVEGSAQYQRRNLFANLNATWQRVVKHEHYLVYKSQTYSTPAMHANLTVAGAPYHGKGSGFFNGGTLWVRGTTQFQTATYCPTIDLLRTMVMGEYATVMNRIAPQCVVGIGANYEWKYLDINLSLKNLFNNNYSIGSMISDGVPHAGRSFLAKVTVKF
jgi:outer membrane receptor protein involved in Fe transport